MWKLGLRGPDIPFLGIFVSNFRHFVFAVHLRLKARNGCPPAYLLEPVLLRLGRLAHLALQLLLLPACRTRFQLKKIALKWHG
jgi:hypothetical protein